MTGALMTLDDLMSGLRAVAEPTRCRILALCARGELTVTELTQILGQSQPRVSRHLKLLVDAGLLERLPEGTWAFYRLAESVAGRRLARDLPALLDPSDDVVRRDLERLTQVKQARADQAAGYFKTNAERWNEIRSLYVDEQEVESALLALFADRHPELLVDVGTGTGRVLEIFADRIGRGLGIDLSHEMLTLARANFDSAGIHNVQVRHGDMYALPLADGSVDATIVHQVLHYATDPAGVIAEAARVLRPGGRLVVIDFAPHDLEFLRQDHAHRRLGFADGEVRTWLEGVGLRPVSPRHLAGGRLTVGLWAADKPLPKRGVR